MIYLDAIFSLPASIFVISAYPLKFSPVKILSKKTQLPGFATSVETDQFSKKITAAWQGSLAAILKVAQLCADADKAVPRSEKTAFIASLPFSRPTFSKLVAIGKDRRLYAKELRKQLPPSFSVLYEITHLKDGVLYPALNNGTINPEVSRTDVLRLSTAHSKSAEGVDPTAFFAEVRLPLDFPVKDQIALNDELVQLVAKYSAAGAAIIRPRDTPGYQKALAQWEGAISRREQQVVLKMRQLLNAHFREMKRKAGVGFLKRDHPPHPKWAYDWSEYYIEINDPDLRAKIDQVIQTMGEDVAFYEKFRERAESSVPYTSIEKCEDRLRSYGFSEATRNENIASTAIPKKGKKRITGALKT